MSLENKNKGINQITLLEKKKTDEYMFLQSKMQFHQLISLETYHESSEKAELRHIQNGGAPLRINTCTSVSISPTINKNPFMTNL